MDLYTEGRIDLVKLLVKHPEATFIVPVDGDSMIEDGIDSGDLLVVDSSVEAKPNSIVVVDVDGELTVKKISKVGCRLWLVPGNKSYPPMEIKGEQNCRKLGVVTFIIKKKNGGPLFF